MHKLLIASLALFTSSVFAEPSYQYSNIAQRYGKHALSEAKLTELKMQAECLVGIKKLNFKRKDSFDPIAEWTSFRTRSLLEQYSPCETLVMLELAQKQLRAIASK